MARNTNINITFCKILYLPFFLCYGLIWHIISTNVPLNFNILSLFGIPTCKYAPGTWKLATSLPLYESITSVVNKPSRDTVGDAKLPPSFKYPFFLLPFLQVITFMTPFIFSFTRLTASSYLTLSASVSSSGSNGITTIFPGIAPSSNFLNYFIITTT